jgi:hypothetical protein
VNDAVQYLAVLRKGGGAPDQEDARPQRGDLRMRQRISRAHYASLGDLFDPSTFRRIDALGIRPGWRCWEAAEPGFEVLRHDVAAERAPAAGFDLVHARLVVMHLADRGAALAAMTGALRPGGWLLLEDADLSLQPLASTPGGSI